MVLPPLGPSEATLTLFEIGQHQRARCLDGSPSGYYKRSGDPEKFVITLQGGTPCVEKQLCKQQSVLNKGSSRSWTSRMELNEYFANSTSLNPVFADYTQVFVPYCSGDMWSGMRWNKTWNLYFYGHYILDALLDELIATTNIAQANEVIFTGDSTGAMGVFSQLDYLQQKLQTPVVKGVPIAGWEFPNLGNETYRGSGELKYIPLDDDALKEYYELWGPYVPTECTVLQNTPDDDYKCQLADTSFGSIKSQIFVVNSQTDASMMTVFDGMPPSNGKTYSENQTAYMAQWAVKMKSSLDQVKSHDTAGLFNPACYMHIGFGYTSPKINNMTYKDAFQSWLGGSKIKLQDDCGIHCNPSCPQSTT